MGQKFRRGRNGELKSEPCGISWAAEEGGLTSRTGLSALHTLRPGLRAWHLILADGWEPSHLSMWPGPLAGGSVPEKASPEQEYQKAQADAIRPLMTNLRSLRTWLLPHSFGQAYH